MFRIQNEPFLCEVQEACGLAFGRQVVEIAVPASVVNAAFLRDRSTGRLFPLQQSTQRPGAAFLQLEIGPFEELKLEVAPDGDVREFTGLKLGDRFVANEKVELKLAPDVDGPLEARQVPGPVTAINVVGRAPRGWTYFDAVARVASARGEWLEMGPLRAVWSYRVEFEGGTFYAATVTLDLDAEFAVVDEELGGGAGAQFVWDFADVDWPEQLFLLDSTPGGTFRKLHAHFDARHARLAAWTQYQQLHDLSDGFALIFSDDLLGVVTLGGGSWSGNRLNHLEGWTRRFWRDQPATRRAEPWDAKADSQPGPDAIPERGPVLGSAHFCLEGWIGAEGGEAGHRRYALVAAPLESLFPGAENRRRGDGSHSDHFENRPDRAKYHREQSLLRRINVQHGVLPLQDLLDKAFVWPVEAAPQAGTFAYPHQLLASHLSYHGEMEETRIAQMTEYLASRVYGFWEGAGPAHSNCVVGRVIAPEMFHYEFLAANKRLGESHKRLVRAHFAFLCHLFNADNYYPGAASMTPVGDALSSEPTIAGMANQNFFTDVMCVAATGAQVFARHPNATLWHDRFTRLWRRQLQFHRYPQSGVWEESHTYFLHVLHTVLPVLLRRRDDGAELPDGGFADPLFRSLCVGIEAQLTPPHAHAGGLRHILAWGDHEAGRHEYHNHLFQELARAFVAVDPVLAEHMAWLSQECGGEPAAELLGDPLLELVPKRDPWVSGALEGLGYCFRTAGKSGQEALLALRAGGAWGHHHHDDGSIQFFAQGEAQIVDAAFGHPTEDSRRKLFASGHSRWSPRDLEPFDYFWRFNRGWICAHDSEALFPYAVAWTPVYMVSHGSHTPSPLWPAIAHWRSVIQLAPEVFLIVDESDATIPQTVRFQLPGKVLLDQGHAVAQNGATRLYVQPLKVAADIKMPEAHWGIRDVPRKLGDERFSTQEVIFQTGLAQRSVFVVAAVETLSAQYEEGAWQLSAPDWSATVKFSDAGIELTNSTGETATFAPTTLRKAV